MNDIQDTFSEVVFSTLSASGCWNCESLNLIKQFLKFMFSYDLFLTRSLGYLQLPGTREKLQEGVPEVLNCFSISVRSICRTNFREQTCKNHCKNSVEAIERGSLWRSLGEFVVRILSVPITI